ncbi:uncharacterized protein EI90DRAFT_3118078 [Cantharellus anzutake]|uniref:uncharacterized protein n=1 Tax=Cantharellus anzutake TaxID=1750568 RepID=UPI001905F90A|nr:uncharacterized protein EI90DRAFT_3118078 [Cantharellus anzutake]KAF8339018.1 hypothetical protein EI90DRAFT_3118078 [Cantharellus anzutake]
MHTFMRVVVAALFLSQALAAPTTLLRDIETRNAGLSSRDEHAWDPAPRGFIPINGPSDFGPGPQPVSTNILPGTGMRVDKRGPVPSVAAGPVVSEVVVASDWAQAVAQGSEASEGGMEVVASDRAQAAAQGSEVSEGGMEVVASGQAQPVAQGSEVSEAVKRPFTYDQKAALQP